jgi:hypothetical protein
VPFAVTLLPSVYIQCGSAVGYYYFSAWLIFGVVTVAMKYFAPHSAVPYRVISREYENVKGKEE